MKSLSMIRWVAATRLPLLLTVATQCSSPDPEIGASPATGQLHTIQSQFANRGGLDSVLSRSCGDCHSNTIRSAWYTRTPVLSSLMSNGARDGRKAVNFAEWQSYTPEQQRGFLVASCSAVKSGRMPVGAYVRFNSQAKLSERDVETICGAAQ